MGGSDAGDGGVGAAAVLGWRGKTSGVWRVAVREQRGAGVDVRGELQCGSRDVWEWRCAGSSGGAGSGGAR